MISRHCALSVAMISANASGVLEQRLEPYVEHPLAGNSGELAGSDQLAGRHDVDDLLWQARGSEQPVVGDDRWAIGGESVSITVGTLGR